MVKGKVLLLFSVLMFFVFVISPTMEARGIPTNAKPEGKASELANAELDAQKRTIVYKPIACYCAPGSSYRRSIGPYPHRCPPDFPYRRCRSVPPTHHGQPPPQYGQPPPQHGQPPPQYGQPPPQHSQPPPQYGQPPPQYGQPPPQHGQPPPQYGPPPPPPHGRCGPPSP